MAALRRGGQQRWAAWADVVGWAWQNGSPMPNAPATKSAALNRGHDGQSNVLADLALGLRDDPAFSKIVGRRNAVVAVSDPARAFVMAGISQLADRAPLVVVTATGTEAEHLAHDLKAFLGDDNVLLFPAWETLPFERVSPSVETMGQRMRTMWMLRQPDRTPSVIVTGVRSLIQRLSPHAHEVEPVVLTSGMQIDPAVLAERLAHDGYRREYVVEHRGEFSVRGSIVDVFPSTSDTPVRIDLWGDDVERLTEFSVNDQRTTIDVARVEIFPCRELLPTDDVKAAASALIAQEPWGKEQWERLAEGLTFDGMESWLPWLSTSESTLIDLLPDDALLVMCEPRRMRDRAADILAEEADLERSLSKTWGVEKADFPKLHIPFDELLADSKLAVWTLTPAPDGPDTPVVGTASWDSLQGDGQALVKRCQALAARRTKIVLCAETEASRKRITDMLALEGIDMAASLVMPLDRGVIMPEINVAILTEADVTGRRRSHRKPKPPSKRDTSSIFEDLKTGDYIVHVHHGVGRYGGMVKRAIGGSERDYLLLEYKGGDKLYVPSDQIDTVRQYTGGESPSLHRLGGTDFAKAKSRVRSAAQEVAGELVVLYQKRVHAPGHPFAPDTPWQTEMEDAFPYALTPDQHKAVDAIKANMEQPIPMDHLVVGDVGFGKTEVAVRAAFKAVQDGKQVCVLVPTTLLAQQHFVTFSDRMAGYPIRVEVLSRFLTTAQARKVSAAVESGEVDVLIGTHRVLGQDVKFKDLGLLVVDEEQRFGVNHKEAMKKLKTNVDVLTLTATPIPRTLEMSLTGIRDFTLLQTPPADRQPILTYVGEWDERAAGEAIRRELLREGQVFFVHNRVVDIDIKAEELRELVPEARIAVAHGQMDDGTLEKVVYDFWEGHYDVLVCTTIIESGIDMPTVNTLVVDRADMLGLGQLHQLRGRVGRAGSRAYAYLFHPRDKILSEQAYERLKTIGEATALGSGFKIAMRDLEIRGAGNLLGESQSGHIAAVGYDLYCQMVSEAVAELKGEPIKQPAEIKLDLPLDANLPSAYVEREELRLEAYRRLAGVTTPGEVVDIRTEWLDRYGPLPKQAELLLSIARLRAECHRLGIKEVSVSRDMAKIQPVSLKISQEMRLKRLAKSSVYKADARQIQIPVMGPAAKADMAAAIVAFLAELIPDETPVVISAP